MRSLIYIVIAAILSVTVSCSGGAVSDLSIDNKMISDSTDTTTTTGDDTTNPNDPPDTDHGIFWDDEGEVD